MLRERFSAMLDRNASVVVILCALAVLPALSAWSGAFLRDDRPYVLENMDVMTDRPLFSILETSYPPHSPSCLWRPLTTLSFRIDRVIGDADPRAFKATNLLLHVAATLSAFALARRTGLGRGVAASAAALFAVHPTHVEVAAEITGRAESLAFVFATAGVLVLSSGNTLIRRLSGGALVFASALSKENGPAIAVAGFVFLVLARAITEGRVRRFVTILVAGASALLAKWWFTGHVVLDPGVRILGDLGLTERIATAARLSGFDYPLMSLWPDEMRYEYPDLFGEQRFGAATAIGAVTALTLAVFALRVRRTAPRVTATIGFYAVAILPFLHLVTPIGETAAQRFFFTPSFAWALGAAMALGAIPRSLYRRIAISVLVSICAAMSFHRGSDFSDESTLYARELSRHADAPKGRLSAALRSPAGRTQAAVRRDVAAALDAVIADYPRHYEMLYRRAAIALEENDQVRARRLIAQIREGHPQALGLETLAGLLARRSGDEESAARHFALARSASAHDPLARLELANVALFENDRDRAEVLLIEAMRASLTPENAAHLLTAATGLADIVRRGLMEPDDFRRLITEVSAWVRPDLLDARGRNVKDVLASLAATAGQE